MDRNTRILLAAGVAAFAGAVVGGRVYHFEGYVFVLCVWLLPALLGGLFYLEHREHPLWQEEIGIVSKRGAAYGVALLGTLFWPYLTILPSSGGVLLALKTPLFWIACFGAFIILLFLFGGKQPAMREGKFIPLLFALMTFVLVMFV